VTKSLIQYCKVKKADEWKRRDEGEGGVESQMRERGGMRVVDG
jgi:hypothetical protein